MDSELPQRLPGAALDEIVPAQTGPSPVNLFGVPAGEVVHPSFRLSRLRLVRDGDGPETAA